MPNMTGVVEQVSTKDVNTKFGPKPTYSAKVNGTWVKFGFKNPKVNVGDEISFNGESGTYGLEAKDVTVVSRGASPASSAPVPVPTRSSTASSSRVFPIPPLHGDRSIVRQNALARAVELFTSARGGKAFDVDDVATAIIIRLARGFEAYTAGDLDLAEAMQESSEKGE